MWIDRTILAAKRSTAALMAAVAAATLAGAARGQETCHDAAVANAPSAVGIPWLDFFTGDGHYMPRTHCLTLADGKSDWPWIATLLVLTGGVIVAYLRIFYFWMRAYFGERASDRNPKLVQLAGIFLFCAICGYGMSMLMFVWPAYRLLAFFLLALNACSWAFCWNIERFKKAFSADRLERQLRETLESRARELEEEVRRRTREVNRLAEIARRTANAVVITDRAGLVEWVNEGFTRMTGFSSAEIVGRKPGEMLQGPLSDRAEIAKIREAVTRGEPVTAELVNYHKNGGSYIIRMEIEPLFDERGELNGFMAIESDVTSQRQYERKIREQGEQLETLVHNLPGVAFRVACDEKWTNLFVSDAIEDLTGYPASDFINNAVRDCASITHPDDIPAIEAAVAEAMGKRSAYNIEYRIMHKSGQTRWVNERASVICEGDRPLYLDGVQFDITELREAREAASAANQSKSEFLASMSHEIRTPMTAILGFADLLAESASRSRDAESVEHVETIRRNGQHLLALINDILDLSKIEAGKLVVESIDFSPQTVIQEVIETLSPRAAAKGISLNAEFLCELPRVIQSDPIRFRQILTNLVGNAIKFTEVGGVTVRIGIDQSQPVHLQVDVVDTGVGMSAEEIGRLFQAYEQANATTTRRFGGTGLGLRISKRLAEHLGGTIEVTSEKGKGSRFRATIALVAGVESLAAIAAPAAERTDRLDNVSILVAEDGPDNVRFISHVLRKAGAVVKIVSNGEELLAALTVDGDPMSALRPHPGFDLIITDMQMPVMDGYAAVGEIRARGGTLPIVALTAHAMSGDRVKCLAAGCDDYLTKPIDRARLIAICSATVQKRRHAEPAARSAA
ncbi:MAG: PAS domain-containing protein [Phycisphaerales bacterium]|nr:PAS domain-containing protein [Phycisphaerales bacterium]